MSRQTISAAALHEFLDREFQRARSVDCVTRCRMPQPIFREPDSANAANWRIDPPLTCPRHCHRFITDVVAKLAAMYDIEPPTGSKQPQSR